VSDDPCLISQSVRFLPLLFDLSEARPKIKHEFWAFGIFQTVLKIKIKFEFDALKKGNYNCQCRYPVKGPVLQ
jgi:hypothetical protein